jgi:lipoate-protein ligase A
MHGEYKVPGGKLVVVDLEVVDGRFGGVRIAGDFFLEPDTALDAMNAAITGKPADASAKDLASAIRSALPADAELLGITPEGVATAVRRAVSGAKEWVDYPWRLLRGPSLSPRVQVALDEVLADRVGAGLRAPTLRFWEWDRTAVVIGSFQSVRNEVDFEAAERYDVEIVRRISGGGAMYMAAGQVIVYSIYAPVELVQGMSFADSYAFLDEWAVAGLRALGIDATYQPLNDIASPTGKIGGAAQKRLASGGLLHHVTMSYDMDGARMMEILRIGREKLSDKGVASAAKRVDPLRSQTGLEREAVVDALIGAFGARHGLREDTITPDELAAAEELAATKFASDEWTYRVP